MSTCRFCRFWLNPDAEIFPDSWGECELTGAVGTRQEDEASLAFAVGFGPTRVYLYTSPDFGCVQFQAEDG